MTEVAGEVADGVITHGVSSPKYLREVTLPALERGLAQSGRARADIEVTCPGFISVVERDDQMPKARAAMRKHLSYYASTPAYRPVPPVTGRTTWLNVLPSCAGPIAIMLPPLSSKSASQIASWAKLNVQE